MTRGRAVAPLLVLLAGLLAAPATATPALRTLTVRGVPNAYADVTFPSRMRLEVMASSKTPPRFSFGGTYAGAYLEPVRRGGPAAGTAVVGGGSGFAEIPFQLARPEWLPAGRYRVHLLGDSATTVRISVAGLGRDTTVTTRTPSDVRTVPVRRGVLGVTAPADRTIVPFTVRPGTLTILGAEHESTGFYGRREVCVRPRSDGRSPCLDGDRSRGRYWGVYPFTWTMGAAGSIPAGTLPPGEYEVELLDATVGVPHAYRTFLLTLN